MQRARGDPGESRRRSLDHQGDEGEGYDLTCLGVRDIHRLEPVGPLYVREPEREGGVDPDSRDELVEADGGRGGQLADKIVRGGVEEGQAVQRGVGGGKGVEDEGL